MIHRWEVEVITSTGEWRQSYPTRIQAHVSYHNRTRLSPIGAEIYMYDLEKQELVKWRIKGGPTRQPV